VRVYSEREHQPGGVGTKGFLPPPFDATIVGVTQAADAPLVVADRSALLTGEFLAVGGATVVLFPLVWLLRAAVGADASELAAGFLTFHVAHVVNDPHFSVTYLLFYRDVRGRALGPSFETAQRIRYLVAGFVVPAALMAWAAYALVTRSAQTLGLMIQLMFLLVGWHYVKQGFGVLTVLSARRGVALSARERRVVLFHCYAAWAFAWANPATAAGKFEEKGVVYRAYAHPRWLEVFAGGVLAVSVVALIVVLGTAWRRERRRLPLGPFVAFLATVWVWSIYSTLDPVVRYFIPALHSVQYLYFVWLLRRNEHVANAGPFSPPPTARLAALGLSALGLGFALFHGVPGLLDATLVPAATRGVTNELGPAPFAAAFFVVVNIHHYFMDTVLWRRDNPETRYLTSPS
jgi:hypothetical protein